MSDVASFDLGAFSLVRPLARGGLGQVWRGVHRRSNLPVAVKLLSDDWGGNPQAVTAFQHEVRSVARLNHPNVVRVLDYGLTPDDASERSQGVIAAGAPWLVMELAGGSLDAYEGRLYWRDLHGISVALCEALAHAHARRLLHLDVKPGNVLHGCRLDGVEPAADPLEGLRLADFGISRARGELEGKLAGTPLFMAPEQILGDVEALGPWTDLYALGATLWCLASGRPPFSGNDIQALMRQHLLAPLPDFSCLGGAPQAFEDWLRWLLEKRGPLRPQSAGAALTALLTMIPDDVRHLQRPRLKVDGPRSADTFDLLGETLDAVSMPEIALAPERHIDWPAPTLPAQWRRVGGSATEAVAILDAGLGLLGLREVPLVGRDDVCDALWGQLLESVAGEGARFISLEGPGGCGRTRMLRWFAERCDESGAVTTLRSEHSEGNPGLRGAIVSALGLAGVPEWDRLERMQSALPGLAVWKSNRLAQWLFEDSATPLDLVVPLLTRIAMGGPLLWVMDDFTEDEDVVRVVRAVLSLSELPVLMVGSLSSDAPPGPGVALADGIPADRKGVVTLAPLARKDLSRLLVDLLRLDPWLASSVVAQARGLPADLVSRLVSWSVAGALFPGKNGFEVEETYMDKTQTTRPVLDHLVATARGPNTPWMHAIELAAAGGMNVNLSQWEGAIGDVDVPSLLRVLLDARIARETPGGWAFRGPRLLRAARHNAIRQNRWASHHAVWAALVPDDGSAQSRLARGRHLHMSGQSNQALKPLVLAIEQLRISARLRLAQEAWIVLEGALEASDLPLNHPQREDAHFEQLKLVYVLGNPETMLETSKKLIARAQLCGWNRVLVRAHNTIGNYLLGHQREDEALERFQLATSIAERTIPDTVPHVLVLESIARAHRILGHLDAGLIAAQAAVAVARREPTGARLDAALAILADLHVSRHEFKEAEQMTAEVLEVARRSDEPLKVGCALVNVSEHAARRGELAMARATSTEGLHIIREAGADMYRGWALLVTGQHAQRAGDLDDATTLFSEAATLAYSTNENMATYPVIHLAQVEILRGRIGEANRRLKRLRDVVGSKLGSHSSMLLDTHLLWTLAGIRDLEGSIQALGRVEEHLLDRDWRAPEFVEPLQKTYELMQGNGWLFADRVAELAERVSP